MHIPAVVVGFSAILSLLINFPLLLFSCDAADRTEKAMTICPLAP